MPSLLKGGTSLSKVYDLIQRFSEDIDLILAWNVLGYSDEMIFAQRSNTQQQKFIDESRDVLFSFIQKEFLPVFRSDISAILNRDANVFIREEEPGVLCFAYPRVSSDSSILPEIRIEMGTLAAWDPATIGVLRSYAAVVFPAAFSKADVSLRVTTAERTFWEKATILHQEAHRPENSLLPHRYSRHYYDMWMMANSWVKDKALANPDLLKAVVDFKIQFYPRKWAKYEEANFKTIRLLPPVHSLEALRKDYADMANMIFGARPSFDEILNSLANLEKEIHAKSETVGAKSF